MRWKLLRWLAVVNLVASVLAGAWALLLLTCSGLILYDTHFEVFKWTLSEEQGGSIIRHVNQMLREGVWPLLLTNSVWVALAVAALARRNQGGASS